MAKRGGRLYGEFRHGEEVGYGKYAVATRGMGRVDGDGVIQDYKFISADLVLLEATVRKRWLLRCLAGLVRWMKRTFCRKITVIVKL